MRARVHNKLPRWQRSLVYALSAALVLTGLGWLVAVYVMAPAGEPTPAPHAWAGPLLALHGIAAYAALIAYAFVGHVHVRTGWREPALRPMGVALGVSIVVLAVTGLVFYYVANESAIPYARWTHVATGLVLPVVLALHIRNGRRARAR